MQFKSLPLSAARGERHSRLHSVASGQLEVALVFAREKRVVFVSTNRFHTNHFEVVRNSTLRHCRVCHTPYSL